MPPRAMSSSISRFRRLSVLNMISSTVSFSNIVQGGGLASLNSFFRTRVSHGFWNLESNVLITKLKKVLRFVYRFLLVVCLVPSVSWVKNDRISSVVMDSNFLLPKWLWNLDSVNTWFLVVFFFGVYFVIIDKIINRLWYFHFTPPVFVVQIKLTPDIDIW